MARTIGREARAHRLMVRRLVEAGLLDPRWYARTYGARPDAYIGHGAAAGHDPAPGFDAARYRALHPDAAIPPLHFLERVERQDAALGPELRARIEHLPRRLHVGRGTVLYVKGWCYPTRGRIRLLDLYLGERRHPILDHSQARPDVALAEAPRDPEGRAFLSGFETLLEIPALQSPATMPVVLRLITDAGEVCEQTLGEVTLLPGTGAEPLARDWPGQGPRVAIAMATHNPPLDLFAAQVASIAAQTHRNLLCIVSDDASSPAVLARMETILAADPRFVLVRNPERRGFYGNFERALRLVPRDADYIALSDQDDRWHADKIETLLGTLGDATLVYADARIVDRDGTVRAETFWTTRRNNFTSLPSLLAANTVVGAASLFRASMLDTILPFPERLGGAYHDHWIGLSALTAGRIAYVDRPLHDYVQHGGNVIGHKRDADAPGLRAALGEILGALRGGPLGHVLRTMLVRAAADRQGLVVQKVALARILLLRHPTAAPDRRRALRRLSGLTRLWPAARERLLAALERRPTLNHEGHFLRAVLISRGRDAVFRALAGRQRRRLRRLRLEAGLRNMLAAGQADAPLQFHSPGRGRDIPAMEFGHVGWIFHNVAPLTLRSSDAEPERVNLLLATIDFTVLFGGYIGMFNLALRLAEAGHAVRLVLLDETEVRVDEWRARIAAYPGLERLFDRVEIAYRYDRGLPLDVSPHDAFVATSAWNAHVAHKAARALGHPHFLFLVQEYEPVFDAHNTNTALMRQAYDFPQRALFSTALLRDYFRENRIGVFATEDGEAHSAVFSNAIQRFAPTRAALARRSRRILFYARPEPHAARNMFEMGIAALCALFADPAVAAEGWTAHGIGTTGSADRIVLAPGIVLQMVPKMSLKDYVETLPGFDVGLSLMLTPHPSLVPLEMAAAGLVTVTNTYANKTAAALGAISPNLIGAPPTLEGIVEALREALRRADDLDARLAGAAAMSWPHDWDAAFPPETMARIDAFLADQQRGGERAPGATASGSVP